MCRSKDIICPKLGPDPAHWSNLSPLTPEPWFEEQLDIFVEALDAYVGGSPDGCLARLAEMRTGDIQRWYIEHALWSGKQRATILGSPKPAKPAAMALDPVRSPKKLERQVFHRDGHRCRYCGRRLVARDVLKGLKRALNSSTFAKGPRDEDTHGAFILFEPVADHVTPYCLGGRTDFENIVTSCNPCNYGKAGYTIEELAMHDPFERPPTEGWDGLEPYLQQLPRG